MSQTVQLVITAGPQGMTVSGPIENLVMAYGMLEMAKQIIAKAAEQKAGQRVVPATVMPPNGHVGL